LVSYHTIHARKKKKAPHSANRSDSSNFGWVEWETFVSKMLPDGEVLVGELYSYNTNRLIGRKLMPSILLN
jgi:hypothetical protein